MEQRLTHCARQALFAFALFAISAGVSAANFPYIRLNNQTNRVSDNGTALTFNGTPVGTGGSSLWTNYSVAVPDGSTLYVLKPLSNGVAIFATNFLVSTYGEFAAIVSIGYPPIAIDSVGTNNTSLFSIGTDNDDFTGLEHSADFFQIGAGVGVGQKATNTYGVWQIGDHAGWLQSLTNASDIYNWGHVAGNAQILVDSFDIINFGTGAGANQFLTNSHDINNYGSQAGLNQSLTNSLDIYELGSLTGVSGSNLQHIMILGTHGTATNSNDFVFGDNAYNYFFPGASSTFEGPATFHGAIVLGGVSHSSWPAGGSGNVVNTGPSVAGMVPVYTDTSGTAVTPTNVVSLTQVITTPITVTQDNTNLVVNFTAGAMQLVTATNDLYFIASNIVAGASVLLDISAGTTNRNLTFDTGTTWMSAQPSILSSNHVMWVSLTSTATTTNGIRNSANQSFP